ncbi:Retrotransposable element Tf2 protein [Rhizoctonia solani]|uniref:Retrotransposable element Tf2 protein n=1 Tax=Rhizoctonia solani TaxID=456999 RepID=A0A8H8P6M4_9AGAM|nr:Retrotransposable element Tf2 protein [Rhizoctonia solani]QRW25683.1 Retrotransposable element Tf2 protein [Rhizoctonia solani]
MATRSRTASQAQSPFDQGYMEPQLLPTTPVEYGKVSLERVTRLLLGLLSQVKRLKQEIAEIKEAGVETQTNVENISQTVDVVKDGLKSLQLQGPRTPEGPQPKAVEETPRPLPKAEPIGLASGTPFWSEPSRASGLAQPTPRRAVPLQVPSPPPSLRLQSPIGAPAPPPPAPAAAYPAPVKIDHPDAYTGKIGSEAKQWLTRMLAWTQLNSRMFPTDQEVLSFLLMNMKDSAGAWAHPHLNQLGSHQAIIQTVEGFKLEFLAAFGNPDATRAAKRKITSLTQSGTCADYITKFRTLAMELDWNNAALRGQFARGLHWEVSRQIATRKHRPRTLLKLQNAALVIDNALRKERASHPPRDNKPSKQSNPARGTSTGQSTTGSKKLSNNPNFVSEEERNRRRAAGACIKCGKMGHKFAECRTGWKATPIEDKGKAKETAKIGKDSKYQSGKEISPLFTILIKPENQAEHLEVLIDSGATLSFLHPRTAEALRLPLIDLPTPRTVTMLNGSSPQAGKIWKKAHLTFLIDDKRMTETFLICNTGMHAAILGIRWLETHNPEIDWNLRTLSFPHNPPEHVAIAKEEEADQNPLEGVPSKYHQYARVFGEEEFNKLPPHRHYNIGIELTEEGPLNSPLYSMTDADQQQEDGRLHPLGFLSESFKGAKQNYDTHDKELLAIIRSFEYWRIFLEGSTHPVTVFTDHRNLEYWKESRTFNPGYNFQIVYRPGKQSGKPDALSRRADHANIPPAAQTMLPDPVFANVALVTPEKELQRQIEAALDQDESLEEILQFLQNESKAPPSIKRAFKDYEMEAGLLSYQGRIVVPDVGTLRTDLLRIFHDSPLAGHPGRQQTLELVSRNYYWPGIQADAYWHVDSCETCQRIRKPKYASIPPQPLELPSRPWQHVSYNMIVDLPKDGNSDSILVIVDSFTKYVILVECSKKLKAPELADLFLRHVWKRYGMPEKTVSDRGRVFNNKFLKALYQRLGIDPHFSSAYHPQSDGQTERVNPTVEHFLRAYSGVNQKDWVKWLPMAEFAYNNAVHSSTGKSLFKALYGWEPSLTPSNVPTDVPEADNLATQMESQWREIEAALRQSKTRMVAGEVGEPLEFEIGEEAWLDAKNVKLKTLSLKLTEQRLGPFKVTKKISNRAYRLELPPTMRIHNNFYVGLLSKVKRDKKRSFENRPPPVTVDGEEEYEVEGITDMEERNGKWFFRVKWKGYGSEENTWEPRENLKNAEKILEKFEKEMKKKALGAAKALRGGQCCKRTTFSIT